MATVTRGASTKTTPKGGPTPSQGVTKQRSAKTEDRIALFQWLVFAVIVGVIVIAAIVVGPADGTTVVHGGHGG